MTVGEAIDGNNRSEPSSAGAACEDPGRKPGVNAKADHASEGRCGESPEHLKDCRGPSTALKMTGNL
jgi:hypothetical protein